MNTSRKSALLAFSFLFFTLFTVLTAYSLQMGNQDIRSRASEPISFQPPTQVISEAPKQKLEKSTSDVIRAFDEYKKTSNSPKQEKKEDLIRKAKARKELLLSMVESAPREVFSYLMDSQLRSQLPDEIKPYIEEESIVEGELESVIFDNFENDSAKTRHYLHTTDAKRIELISTDPDSVPISYKAKVRVKGHKLEDTLIFNSVLDDNFRTIETQVQGVTASVSKKIAVILFNFQNNAAQPWTTEYVRGITFSNNPQSARTYYDEISYGSWKIEGKNDAADGDIGDVYGWYTIPYTNDQCSFYSSWATAAVQAATNDGHDMTGYQKIIYAFPNTTSCTAGGWAPIGGPSVFIQGGYSLYTVLHELGHAFGANHAQAKTCFDASNNRVAISDNCTFAEYGDPYDVMGAVIRHTNVFNKGKFGFFEAGNTQTVTTDGTYTIAPQEKPTSAVQTVRIPYTTNYAGVSVYYYLEYRQPYGYFDALGPSSFVTNGVSIRTGPSYTLSNTTQLLDTTFEAGNFSDAPLAVGKTFVDPKRGVSITTESVSPEGATVTIRFNQSCIHANPSISIAPPSQFGIPGQGLTYSVTLTNNDNQNCGNSTFSVIPALPSGWSQSPASLSESLAAGTSITRTVTVTSSSAATDGFYPFTERATFTSDAAYTAHATANYNVVIASPSVTPTPTSIPPSDTVSPQVRITNPVNNSNVSRRATVHIISTAADNVGVTKLEVYINGNLLCRSALSSYTCLWQVPNKPRTSYEITAKAFDAAGNIGTGITKVTSQ